MRRPAAVAMILLLGSPTIAGAVTARDLSSRIKVDGYTTDFTDDEKIFGVNPDGSLQEASDDSKWGVNDDINQIRITWDAKNLYLAGEGRIWGNNMILFIDSVPRQGLARMDSLNSWRRNFFFDTTGVGGFAPDVFVATWDGNTSPRLITQLRSQIVQDDVVGPLFSAAATFDQGNLGRAMEAAIPWRTVFLSQAGIGVRETLVTVGGVADTLPVFPPGTQLKICGVVTGGGDGTGGPDSAPDNTAGFSSDGSARAVIDNYAIVDLDRNDDSGLGHGGPDGIADWGVRPGDRVSFRFRPPIVPLLFCVRDVRLDRPVLMPDRGERLHFDVELQPRPDPSDANNDVRVVFVSAAIYDVRGRAVRSLFQNVGRPVLRPNDTAQRDLDAWDGRNQDGVLVPPGLYVLRVVTEPGVCRTLRSFVVAR